MDSRQPPELDPMNGGPIAGDPRLEPLLVAARDSRGLEIAVRQVIAHATPVIERWLAAAVRRQSVAAHDAPDLASEAVLRLIAKLHRLYEDPDSEPIANFDDYLFTIVRHVFDDHRRRLDPARSKLTQRIRYVLTHSRNLALWGREQVVCGLAEWSGRSDVAAPPAIAPIGAGTGRDARTLRLQVEAILRRSGAPVLLNDLVDALGAELGGAPAIHAIGWVPAPTPSPDERVQSREYLTQLWREIEELPVAQRVALLLNLSTAEGESIARALVALRIASIRRIADCLHLRLDDLLELWNELPLPDLRIASMLGRTRQQVINLRKSARDRLSRRLGHPRGTIRKGP